MAIGGAEPVLLFHGTRSKIAAAISTEGFAPLDAEVVCQQVCERFNLEPDDLRESLISWRRRDGAVHFTDCHAIAVSYANRGPEFTAHLLQNVWTLVGGTGGCGPRHRQDFHPDCECARCSWTRRQLEEHGYPVVLHVDIQDDLVGDVPPSAADRLGPELAALYESRPGLDSAHFMDLPLSLEELRGHYAVLRIEDARCAE